MAENYCQTCKVQLKNKQIFNIHLKTQKHEKIANNEIQNRFTCSCGKWYVHVQSLTNHKKQCNYKQPDNIKHYCSTCKCSFARKYLLTQHLQSEKHKKRLSNDLELYKCSCGKKYSHKNSLEYHKRNCKITPGESLEKELMIKVDNKIEEEYKKYKQEMLDKVNELQLEMNNLKSEISVLRQKSTSTIVHSHRVKISNKLRDEIVITQENKCNDCKCTLSKFFQIDHKIALQYGGTNDINNLQALCCECHSKKSISENKLRYKIRDAIDTIIKEDQKDESISTIIK